MRKETKSFEKALLDVSSYCASAERCPMEVEQKLRTCGLDDDDVKKILDRLKKDGFLSQERYVSAFVHDKAAFDKWGPLKIRQALLSKRLPEALVDQSIEALEQEDGFREAEQALGRYLLQRYASLLKKNQDPYRLSQLLASSGLQKGFALETVFRIIRSLDLPKECSDGLE